LAHGGEVIRYRTHAELAPPGTVAFETLEVERAAIESGKAAQGVIKKQKETGVWGGNMLGLAAAPAQGIRMLAPFLSTGA
jgi:hypothetical protein